MGVIAKPYTLAAGAVIVASELNANYDILFGEFNGNIDDTNIKAGANINGSKLLASSIPGSKLSDSAVADAKLDLTSVKVLRTGAVGKKVAVGTKAFTLAAGAAIVTITFATDSDDGDPQFGATPRMTLGLVVNASGTDTYTIYMSSKTNTVAVVKIYSNNGADTRSGTLDWVAIA